MSEQWIPEKGQEFIASYDQCSPVRVAARRTRVKGQVFIYDEDGNKYPIEQCYPYNPESPLSDDSIKTLVDACEAIAEAGDADYLVMLESLTREQKQCLWATLTPELQQSLKELRNKSTPQKIAV